MLRDEPVNPHEEELAEYDRESRTHQEEVHRPAPGEWLVIPLIGLRTKGVFLLSAGLFVASVILAIVSSSSAMTASWAPILFAVAVAAGIIAAWYGSALRDERRKG